MKNKKKGITAYYCYFSSNCTVFFYYFGRLYKSA